MRIKPYIPGKISCSGTLSLKIDDPNVFDHTMGDEFISLATGDMFDIRIIPKRIKVGRINDSRSTIPRFREI